MKFILKSSVVILFALSSYGEAPQFSKLKSDVTAKLMMVPDRGDRIILENYLAYLESGDTKKSENVIFDLKKKASKNKKPVSPQWLSFFEGHSEFCLRKTPNICEYSLSDATAEKLKPRVENGEKNAVELVLIYSAAIATDGADAEGLSEYQKIIEKKHPELIKEINLKHKSFFKKMPINWLDVP